MRRYAKLIYLLIGIFALVTLFWYALRSVVLPPDSAYVVYNWQIRDTNGKIHYRWQDHFTSKVLSSDTDPGIFTYTATISTMLLPSQRPLGLVISHPSFQAFDIYINGTLIGRVGDMEHGNSNIWNGVFFFPIDDKFLNGDNIVLAIQGYALYIHGFDVDPFIDSITNVKHYLFTNSLLTDRLYNWAVGASLIVSIGLFVLILSGNISDNKKYFFFALASIAAAVFYLDFTVILYIPIPYFFYKKIIIFAAMMATYFIHNGILAVLYKNEQKPGNIGNWLSVILIIATVVEMLFGHNMITFRRLYTYLFFLVPVVFIYDGILLALEYLNRKESDLSHEIEIILIGMLANSFFVGVDIFQLFRETYSSSYTLLISAYGLMVFILVMNFALIHDFVFVYKVAKVRQEEVNFLRDVSNRDPLTGIYNRNYLTEVLQALSGDVCFLMLDIDHFKKINDTYGHDTGDRVLKHVVSVIGMQIRSHDIVIRYGGEEFLIVLTSCDITTGRLVAERIRKAIKNSIIIVEGNEIRVTVSVGVCCSKLADNVSPDDIWAMIVKADEYLYIAKRSGRDKVVAGECPATI